MNDVSFHILPVLATGLYKLKASSLLAKVNGERLILLMMISCIAFGGLLVPQRPYQVGSICEKHNPITVCKVW